MNLRRSCSVFLIALACFGTGSAQTRVTAGPHRARVLQTAADTWTTTATTAMTSTDTGMLTTGGSGIVWSTGTLRVTETRKPMKPEPRLQDVKLSAHTIERVRLAPASYVQLARRIKLESAATDEARILEALAGRDIKTYDFKLVDNYLYNLALKQGTDVRWVWKPLRNSDKVATEEAGVGWQLTTVGITVPKLYAHAIPERVLARVAALLETLPDAVFLVSDYEVIKPDPFLAISTLRLIGENKLWIIDQWDEPGFTEKPEPVTIPVPVKPSPGKLVADGSNRTD